MSTLVRLYPRAWRERYGAELDDLLANRAVGFAGGIDLIRGALDAHRHPELVDPSVLDPAPTAPVSRQRFEDLRVARRLGIGTLVGAIVWIVGWIVAANGPLVVDGDHSYRDGADAMPIVLGSMILLSGGLIGQLIRLPGQAIVARFGAFVGLLAAPIWALAPWVALSGLVLVAGLVLLALSAWWRGAWNAPPTVGILVSIVAGLALAVIPMMGLPPLVPRVDPMVMIVLAFMPLWLIVGGTLLRLPSVVESDVIGDGPSGQFATT